MRNKSKRKKNANNQIGNNQGKKSGRLEKSISGRKLKGSLSEKNLKRVGSKGKIVIGGGHRVEHGRYHNNVMEENHHHRVRRNSIDAIYVNKKDNRQSNNNRSSLNEIQY